MRPAPGRTPAPLGAVPRGVPVARLPAMLTSLRLLLLPALLLLCSCSASPERWAEEIGRAHV